MKSVLITGTSKGIGFEAELSFARAGYKVFATMRNPEAAATLKKLIADENLNVIIYKMDVDSDESVKQAIETIIKEHGNINVLVNNAGIERHGSIEELPMADFKAIMETNYFGVIRCIQAVLPQMRENKNGCIINVGSVSGKIACTPLSAYCASKYALEALTESLAQEVIKKGVTVNAVSPGYIDTDMTRAIRDDVRAEIVARIPAGRMGYPEDIANAIAFLASEASGYITGTNLSVNGGLHMYA